MNRPIQHLSRGHRFVAGLVLAHLLAALVLAASPRLHHWLHPDENDDDGDCAVVLFLHGAADGVAPGLPAVTAVLLPAGTTVAAQREPAAFVPSVFTQNRVFEHAPPA